MSQTTSNNGFDIDSSTVSEVELSDNIAEDIIDYTRGNVVRNERQCYLLSLCWSSGWMADESNFLSTVLIGSPSGGKTHCVRTLSELLPENSYYSATGGSDKSFIDDDSWDSKKVVVLSELQKLNGEMLEYLKASVGDDGGYTYARSVADESDGASQGERTTQKIEKEPKPFSMTYAQHSIDHELGDRLLYNYIDEGKVINKSVGKMHANHQEISVPVQSSVGGDESTYKYIYETEGLELALKRHFRSMPEGARTFMPEWCFFAYEDCMNWNRSDVKRSSNMTPNLMRASALQNHKNRPTIEDDIDGQTVEKIVVMPQDLANVLSCRRVLLGTTHQYEPRKQSIVNAVRANTELSDWCSLRDVQSWLNENASEVSQLQKQPLREILRELEESFIIEVSERHFDSGAHAYRFISLSDIGSPKLTGFNGSVLNYSSERPLVGVDNPDAPFQNCTDPFRDVPFKQSVEDFRQSLKRSVSSSASSAMNSSSEDDSQDQHTLSGESANTTVIDDPIVVAVYDRLCDVDGAEFVEDVAHEDVLSLEDDGLLDPTHEVYRGTDVTSDGGAYSATEDAFTSLLDDGVVNIVGLDDGRIRIEVSETEVDVE